MPVPPNSCHRPGIIGINQGASSPDAADRSRSLCVAHPLSSSNSPDIPLTNKRTQPLDSFAHIRPVLGYAILTIVSDYDCMESIGPKGPSFVVIRKAEILERRHCLSSESRSGGLSTVLSALPWSIEYT